MSLLKKILLGLVAIIGLFLAYALISPKQITVEQSIRIDAPAAEVHDFVRSLKKLNNETVWQQMDPNVVKKYSGEDGEVGSVYRWESENKNVGVGEQEVTKIVDDELVSYELRFLEPWQSTDQTNMYVSNENDATLLRWDYISQKIPFPQNAMMHLFITPKLKKDFKESLQNIKQAIENE